MAVEKIIEELEKEGDKKSSKKGKKKVNLPKIAQKSKKKKKKDDTHLFNLIIVAVVILGIIGIVFGYTKDKISEINKGGTAATKGLEQQVADLQTQLTLLEEKAQILEKDTLASKNVVIDLFEKTRKIPTKVNAGGWNVLEEPNLSFLVSFPKTWEKVVPVIKSDEGVEQQNIAYLQPIGQTDFINAITIKSDYADFAELLIEEKMEIFGELDALDTFEFIHGKMIYFINLDKNNSEVPTILILTDDNIYRATFNITEKKIQGYFEYRKNFEEILSTFGLVPSLPAEETEVAE
ncbi:hypothetical protein HQ571_02145 [Candidatus Kuenenbacteria bacterium]|nr:hypothetical protein [Candidatus Kuenenbacteria bacterium]